MPSQRPQIGLRQSPMPSSLAGQLLILPHRHSLPHPSCAATKDYLSRHAQAPATIPVQMQSLAAYWPTSRKGIGQLTLAHALPCGRPMPHLPPCAVACASDRLRPTECCPQPSRENLSPPSPYGGVSLTADGGTADTGVHENYESDPTDCKGITLWPS